MAATAQQIRQLRQEKPTGRFIPSVDRLLADKLKGRSVCVIIDDVDYIGGMKGIVEGILGGVSGSADLRVFNWSSFMCVLPDIRADLVVALSPRDLHARLEPLESGLFCFRKNNPGSVFIINNLHNPSTAASVRLARLRSLSMVDHVEAGFIFFPNLVHIGADALDAKV